MADRTSSSSNGTRPGNRAAPLSLVFALLSLATLPIAVAVTESRDDLRLVHAGFAVPLAALFALAALYSSRRARRRIERTIGRSGGQGSARLGQVLGWIGLYVVLIAAISMGVYALEYFVLD